MLIGRSDDPQNPRRVAATKVTFPFGSGSRNPSGPAAAGRNTQAGHTTANRTASGFFSLTPCTNGAVHTSPTLAALFRPTLAAPIAMRWVSLYAQPILRYWKATD